MDARDQHALLKPLLNITMVTLFVVWGVTALTNEDPLWFLRRFDAEAERFVIYWDGTVREVDARDPGYDALMQAFSEALSRPAGYEGSVALSEASIASYRERYRMLEVIFDDPVQIHTRHPMPEAAAYLVPLSGAHADFRRAFAFPGRVPHSVGPLNLREQLFDTLYGSVESALTVASAD